MFTMDMPVVLATATYKHHSISKAKLQSQNANESWETIPERLKYLVEMKVIVCFLIKILMSPLKGFI